MIREATSRSGALVVLKIVIDDNERRLLHYFSGIKAPSNHPIPLLGVIDLSTSGKYPFTLLVYFLKK